MDVEGFSYDTPKTLTRALDNIVDVAERYVRARSSKELFPRCSLVIDLFELPHAKSPSSSP